MLCSQWYRVCLCVPPIESIDAWINSDSILTHQLQSSGPHMEAMRKRQLSVSQREYAIWALLGHCQLQCLSILLNAPKPASWPDVDWKMYLLAILLLLPPCLPLEVKPLSVPAFPGAAETNLEPTTTEVNTSFSFFQHHNWTSRRSSKICSAPSLSKQRNTGHPLYSETRINHFPGGTDVSTWMWLPCPGVDFTDRKHSQVAFESNRLTVKTTDSRGQEFRIGQDSESMQFMRRESKWVGGATPYKGF